MAQQKKKRKWIKWVVLGVIALIIGLIAYGCSRLIATGQEMLSAMGTSVQAKTGDIAVRVQASGTVASKEKNTVKSPVSAKVDEIFVEVGDTVEADTPILFLSGKKVEDEIETLESKLAEIDSQIQMTSNYKSRYITSPVSGRIKAVYAVVDRDTRTAMDSHDGLFLISTDERMKVRISTEEEIEAGTPVTVTVGESEIESTVLSVDEGVATVVIPDDQYEIGQEATVAVKDGPLIGIGSLEANRPFYVSGPSGVTSYIRVKIQNTVSVGTTLIELKKTAYSLDYERLLESREETAAEIQEKREEAKGMTVTAPYAGIVQELNVTEGMEATEDAPLFVLNGTQAYLLTVAVDELDIASVEVGQTAAVVLDAIADVEYTATVTRISGAGDYQNGVTSYDVTLDLDETEKLLPGMSARADILIAEKTDVLLIPVSAISRKDGRMFVTVVPDPTAATEVKTGNPQEEVEVSVGLINGTHAEILSGVEEGQFVLDKAAQENPFAAMMGGPGGGAMMVSGN